MSTAPFNSATLHNFPISFLQWGHRCRRISERETEEKAWNLRPRTENGLRRVCEGQMAKDKKNIWVSLSKEEIEEDLYAMTGGKPSRRPKKRPKTVQNQLDNVFPGLYLVGITVDAYRVHEPTTK